MGDGAGGRPAGLKERCHATASTIFENALMPFALQDLSALLEGQRNDLITAVAREIDLGADGLRDKDILFDRCELDRALIGALHEELRAGGEDAQPEIRRQRIIADIILELLVGRRPPAGGGRARIRALRLDRCAALKPGKCICSIGLAASIACFGHVAHRRQPEALWWVWNGRSHSNDFIGQIGRTDRLGNACAGAALTHRLERCAEYAAGEEARSLFERTLEVVRAGGRRWSKMMQHPTSEYDRIECLKNAESCLEKAGHDTSRRTYWIQQAAVWIHRARGGSETDLGVETRVTSHQIIEGRLVPKP
jgi:hypothetical protein